MQNIIFIFVDSFCIHLSIDVEIKQQQQQLKCSSSISEIMKFKYEWISVLSTDPMFFNPDAKKNKRRFLSFFS